MRSWIALALLSICADAAFGQATYLPVPVAFAQIAVGGDAAGVNYDTLIQIVNNNSAAVTGHLALFSDSGSALAVSFDGQAPQSTLDMTLQSGETRQIRLTLDGPVTSGSMQITYSPADPLTTVILQFRSQTTLLSEVGVDPAFSTLSATDFAAETDASLNTGIAIANPSPATAYVLARLWDPGTGSQFTSKILTLPANGHLAQFLTELFPDVLNVSQLRAKISLDSCSSPTCTFAGGAGFLATALRLNGNQFTTIPVAARPSGGNQVRILPQVAFGGPAGGLNMKTVLYLTTNVVSGVFGTADIFDNDGNPLPASADGAAPSSSIPFTVPGNRVSRIVLSGDQTLRSGWIRLTLSANVHLIASAVFQTFNGSDLASEASVLDSSPITNGLVYVKVTSGVANVGVAFANSGSDASTINIKLFDRSGFVNDSRDITIPPNGHLAQFVTELFPQLAAASDFDGALAIHSAAPFSALALRLSADKLATLPVAGDGMYRPSITGLRITNTQRNAPARVSFQIDVSDFDSDLATSESTSVAAIALIDFGSSGFDSGGIAIDGTGILSRANGTLSGVFQPPHVTGNVPSGTQFVLYIYIADSAGNASNVVFMSSRF